MASHELGSTIRPKVLQCPSDVYTFQGAVYGYTNYHSNFGRAVFLQNKWDGVFGTNFAAGGAPAYNEVAIVNISDGTSNTVMFAEVCNGDNGTQGTRDPRRDCYEYTGATNANPTTARNALLAANWQTAGYAGGWSPNWSYRGYPWREGSIWRTGFTTLLGPNKPCWRPNNDWWQLVSPASSYHSSGVNVCMADGGVRFVRDSINPDTWTAAGSVAGGETLQLD